MNMIFRLMMIILPILFRKTRADFNIPAAIEFRASQRDLTSTGAFLTQRLTSYIDLSVMNFLGQVGILAAGRKRGWIPLVISRSVKLTARPETGQSVSVSTRLAGWDETHICMQHDFIGPDGLLVTGHTIAVIRRGKKRVSSAELLAAIDADTSLPSPPLPPHVLDLIAAHEAGRAQ
jgi:hypothetical protein